MPLQKKASCSHPVYQNSWQEANINTITTVLLLTLLSHHLFIYQFFARYPPPDFMFLIVFSSTFISTGFERCAFIPAAS